MDVREREAVSGSVDGLVCQTHLLSDGVKGRRSLVIQEDGWVLQYGAGDGDALLLPA